VRDVRAVVVAAAAIGVLLGIGGYTFVYARGYSYLTDDPAACANCHIMQDHFDAWSRSSHAAVAGCNDCHTPPGLVPKYLTKARNGFWHSFYFTTGTYHDPLRITARNRDVTERACRVCHAPLTDSIEPAHDAMVSGRRERTSCLRCHETVGHLE
jgi:cytochrome c nitrite reductase small subunit